MGSITSTPKLPKAQAPVIITMPVASAPAPVTATSTATNSSTPSIPDTTTATTASPAPTREENLLSRGRGVLGTVLTSLRGVLADTTAKTSSRKTLLGE